MFLQCFHCSDLWFRNRVIFILVTLTRRRWCLFKKKDLRKVKKQSFYSSSCLKVQIFLITSTFYCLIYYKIIHNWYMNMDSSSSKRKSENISPVAVLNQHQNPMFVCSVETMTTFAALMKKKKTVSLKLQEKEEDLMMKRKSKYSKVWILQRLSKH